MGWFVVQIRHDHLALIGFSINGRKKTNAHLYNDTVITNRANIFLLYSTSQLRKNLDNLFIKHSTTYSLQI